MMNNKKSFSGISFGTLIVIVIILATLILLFIISRKAADEGISVFEKIKELVPFV